MKVKNQATMALFNEPFINKVMWCHFEVELYALLKADLRVGRKPKHESRYHDWDIHDYKWEALLVDMGYIRG